MADFTEAHVSGLALPTAHGAPAAPETLGRAAGQERTGVTWRRQDQARHRAGGWAQHGASVARISSRTLPNSVASLHFPSTDTDFSPFFTSRQTW